MKAILPAIAFCLTAMLCGGSALAQSQRDDAGLRHALLAALEETDSFSDRFEAEVWLLDMASRMARRVPDIEQRLELLKLIHHEAMRASLPPELVIAVIEVESNFDPWAISVAGAQGLMQIMPFWLDELGRPQDSLHHPATNLRFGCTILRHYLDIEKGDLKRALGRYNGSLGRPEYPERVLRSLRERWYRQ